MKTYSLIALCMWNIIRYVQGCHISTLQPTSIHDWLNAVSILKQASVPANSVLQFFHYGSYMPLLQMIVEHTTPLKYSFFKSLHRLSETVSHKLELMCFQLWWSLEWYQSYGGFGWLFQPICYNSGIWHWWLTFWFLLYIGSTCLHPQEQRRCEYPTTRYLIFCTSPPTGLHFHHW